MSSRRADLQLMRRVALRDPKAAAKLFDLYADAIFRYVARRIAYVDAEDVLQEAFKRALVSASTFRGEGSLRSWLYGIARHVLLESWRDRIDPRSFVDGVDPGPGPESMALQGEQQKRRIWALEQLPDEQAIVLELHRADGFSHDEISQILGIRAATSRKRLQRALKVLGRALAGDDACSPEHGHLDSWRRSLLMRVLPQGNES
jgi:RNA polymerase sigma-70 factor (ECF subfamily)